MRRPAAPFPCLKRQRRKRHVSPRERLSLLIFDGSLRQRASGETCEDAHTGRINQRWSGVAPRKPSRRDARTTMTDEYLRATFKALFHHQKFNLPPPPSPPRVCVSSSLNSRSNPWRRGCGRELDFASASSWRRQTEGLATGVRADMAAAS